MANTQAVTWAMVLNILESIDVDVGAAEFLLVPTNPIQKHTISGVSGALDASTTPAVTKVWSSRLTTGAPDTIDLTTLPGQSAVNVDMSGLEIILLAIKPNGANSMTFEEGGANGYPAFGDTNGLIVIPTGGCQLFYTADGIGQVVDGTHKTIDCTGTGTETYDIVIACG